MYRKLYYQMFNAATDALEELEKQNIGRAKEILKAAPIAAEETYLDAEEAREER